MALMTLNGSLDDEIIVPFLDALPGSGYRGVCLHPRDGLTVPYGSVQFWEAMERIVLLARERGLDVWLCDEFSYPSGSDGGRTVAHRPLARARGLRFVEVKGEADEFGLIHLGSGSLLAVLRIRGSDVEDVTDRCGSHRVNWAMAEQHTADYLCTVNVRQVSHERARAGLTINVYGPERPLAEDESLLVVYVDDVAGRQGEAGMPDVSLPEVTDVFLDAAYRPYAEMMGRVGLRQVPMFHDEVKFAASLPWNALIEERLVDLWGEGWRCQLAALHVPHVRGWELARLQYWQTAADLIEHNWFARVAAYCADSDLAMTGHLAGEESILGHWRHLGDPFKNLAHFDIPGYDLINPSGPDDVHRSQALGAKVVQSAAWKADKPVVMAEVFGAMGFHSDLQQTRTLLAWLALHDIDLPVDHSTWTSMKSLRKYDAPPVNSRFNPLDVARCDLWQWHDWFVSLLGEYRSAPDTLVLYPQESFARYRPEERERWAAEVSLLETFFHYVADASLDFLLITASSLAEVVPTADGFTLHGRSFSTLVVPPVASLHEDTFARLSQLREHPGLVWVAPASSASPAQVTVFGPSSPDGESRQVRAATVASVTEASLVAGKGAGMHRLFASRAAIAQADRTLIRSMRRNAQGDEVLVLVNPHQEELTVTFTEPPGQVIAQPFDAVAPDAVRAGDGRWSVRMPPRGVMVIDPAAPARTGSQVAVRHPIGANYRVLGRNAVPLRKGIAQTAAGARHPLVVGDAGTEVVAWEFPFSVERELDAVSSEVLFLLDTESMPAAARVLWDGQALAAERIDFFDVGNVAFRIPVEQLTPGAHSIRIVPGPQGSEGGLLEYPLLVGDFEMRHDALAPAAVDARPWSPRLTWREMGIPCGSGPVEYTFDFDIAAGDAGRGWHVALPECIGVVEVSLDGRSLGRSSWAPRTVPFEDALTAGTHSLTAVVHGSWNNLFSRLNSVTNGLTGSITLRRHTATHDSMQELR